MDNDGYGEYGEGSEECGKDELHIVIADCGVRNMESRGELDVFSAEMFLGGAKMGVFPINAACELPNVANWNPDDTDTTD